MITFAESGSYGSLDDVISMIVICLEWSANFLLGWYVCSWLEEINRRQAEMVAARVSVEKMRQRNQALTTENENLKVLAEGLSCSPLWFVECCSSSSRARIGKVYNIPDVML
jgi:hypothetical protein